MHGSVPPEGTLERHEAQRGYGWGPSMSGDDVAGR
jgi:hypothetical protein